MKTAGNSKLLIGVCLVFSALSQILKQETWWFIQNVNLIFHEAGHVLFLPFGNFLTTLGGSLLEIAIPALVTVYFVRSKQFFSAACTSWWLVTAFLSVSIYASDARERVLPLITNDVSTHDWFNLLADAGLLRYDDLFGYFFLLGGICSLLFLMYFMSRDEDVCSLLPRRNE